MSNKAKGSKAERELFQMFVDNHFRAVRVAGSGVMENADCDLIAGKPGAKYCIEAKSTKKTSKYISKEQMNSFIVFAEIFGLTPVIAVRFNRIGWFFISPKDLEDSGKNWAVSVESAREKGKRFSQFFMNSSPNNPKNKELNSDLIEDYMKDNYIDENDSNENL
ncbi:Holliday junction resolvase Hjc [uncultured archaeon]|nr:Holliday junction resolvase Hjc [uncultured archaeon]